MKKRMLALIIALSTFVFGCVCVGATPTVESDGGVFDAEYYAANNPDVVAAVGSTEVVLYQHFENYGKNEGRLPYATGTDVNAVIAAYQAAHPAVVTTAMSNALRRANSYLGFMSFSKEGLINQLEFEQFTAAEATYAVENCGADWNDQAVKKASSYIKYMGFSHGGLVDQLEFDGFTASQAEYGVAANGL